MYTNLQGKRMIALFLCATLLLGMLPVRGFAVAQTEPVVDTTAATEAPDAAQTTAATEITEGTVAETEAAQQTEESNQVSAIADMTADASLDYVFIATDRHANETIIANLINQMESDIGENALDYLGLGGDMVGSGSDHPAYNSSTVLAEVTGATSSLTAANVDIVAGIHDMNVTDDSGIVLKYQGGGAQIYEGANFYVYGVEEYCISDDGDAANWQAQANAFVSWANGSTIDTTKVIIVLSHYPLHAERGDNLGAGYWHNALNTVATGSATGTEVVRDIIFFHGHNHTVDKTEYFQTAGYTLSIESYVDPSGVATVAQNETTVYDSERQTTATVSATDATIFYNYATAGYLDDNNTATLVTIGEDSMILTKYNNSSNTSSTLGTITRVVTEPDVVGLSVSGTAVYELGASFQAPTVSAYYSDGSELKLEEENYTVSGTYDMDLPGTYTLTYAYKGASAQYTFTVEGNLDSVSAESYTDAYTVGDDLTFAKVYAVYHKQDGTELVVDLQPGDYTVAVYNTDGTECTVDYMNTPGDYVAYVTYDGKTSEEHKFSVGEAQQITQNSVTVSVSGIVTATCTVTINSGDYTDLIPDAAASVAYDITPETALDAGNYTQITFPIPQGYDESGKRVTVYCVDTGEYFADIDNDAATYTVRTTHFSTWVVASVVEEAETGTIPEYPTTTVGSKTIYKLVSSLEAGEEYLIVSANTAGDAYGLGSSTAGEELTILAADDISDVVYIEDKAGALEWTAEWTASSGWAFSSGDYDLGISRSEKQYTLELSGSDYNEEWVSGSNADGLYYSIKPGGGQGGGPGGGPNNSTRKYYLYCDNGEWTVGTDDNNVYFYQKVQIETSVSTEGEVSLEAGENKTVVIDTSAGAANTVTIDPVILFAGVDATDSFEALGGSYTYSVISDPEGILADTTVTDGVFGLSGNAGTATVRVYYTWTKGETTYKIWDTVDISASLPYYTIDITHDEDNDSSTKDTSVTQTLTFKGIAANDTYDLNHVLTLHDVNGETVDTTSAVIWSSSNTGVVTVDENGTITFTGTNGTATITVEYQLDDNTSVTDTIKLTATTTNYYSPSDGGENFPEFPNEGAIRFDKTATAVGNFSQTGIAQVELSMTGVPYTTGNEMDVVVMLDMTGSMTDDGMEAAEEATKAFVEMIVTNEDGSYNDNRVAVYAFNSDSTYELVALTDVGSDEDLETVNTAIDTASANQATGGTPYDTATQKVHDVLAAAKADGIGNDRQQFCVFMSDGGPTQYIDVNENTWTNTSSDTYYVEDAYDVSDGDSANWTFSLPAEYWTNDMKNDGVTVYTVGLLLQNTPSNPSPWSSLSDSTVTDGAITELGSHYYVTSSILKQMATDESKYIDIFDVANANDATEKFKAIATSILEAAENVTVTDKISDSYTLILELPEEVDADGVPEGQEFYIEVLEYNLDAEHQRTGSSTSLMKLYLGKNTDGSYYAASDASGTAWAAPSFEAAEEDDYGYWTTTAPAQDSDTGIQYTVDGTTYYFVADGSGDYNLVSGAAIVGNSSAELIIMTPYFCYNAATRLLVWNADKLSSTELALSYFLYLDGSSSESENPIDPGIYPTNDYAYLTYTNHLGNNAYQTFPAPQLTWNGAQVTYLFYLVNANGQPVNKAGQVVDFANAIIVTAPVTRTMTWNSLEQSGSFDVEIVASEVLPAGYDIYDEDAVYTIHVFEDENGSNVNNHFRIDGTPVDLDGDGVLDGTTTYVYNTRSGEKYNQDGVYAATENFWCKDYNVTVNDDGTYTYNGTLAQREVDGAYYYATDEMGVYTIVSKDADHVVESGFDFASTTVAYAVTWTAALVEDVVVVDYGIPVEIQVMQNDLISGVLNSVSQDPYSSKYAMNTGVKDTGFEDVTSLTLDNGDVVYAYGDSVYYVQKDMEFDKPSTFYYDAAVTYYKDSNKLSGYIYSQVTVIPATTIYYEDSYTFVDYEVRTMTDATLVWDSQGGYADGYAELDDYIWNVDGTTDSNAVQDTDRPGAGSLNDANNLYGNDGAYENYTTYSLGSANKITLGSDYYGVAKFSFYGTGFDIVSVTSVDTGFITVKVLDAQGNTAAMKMVDTYYGYTQDAEGNWVLDSAATDNALYQIPIIKIDLETYGKYTVEITAAYNTYFDHKTSDSTYEFYLDAIRIYNPAGADSTASDAYTKDHEWNPDYYELRNWVITAETFNALPALTQTVDDNGDTVYQDADGNTYKTNSVEGVVFIDGDAVNDSIADYTNYGPNNELYLAPGQSVAFDLNATAPAGYAVDTVQVALKSVGGVAYSKIWNARTSMVDSVLTKTIGTATDLYYDITSLNGQTVVIHNSGDDADAILSITNIKVTYKASASDASEASEVAMFSISRESSGYALMSLRTVAAEPEIEETEATEPETEATEPETEATEPETEATEPETEATEPETEATEPETEPKPNPEHNKFDEVFRDAVGEVLNGMLGWISGIFGGRGNKGR